MLKNQKYITGLI